MRIESAAAYEDFRRRAREAAAAHRQEVLVCCGTGCLANGSMRVAEAFAKELQARGLTAEVGTFTKRTGCHGFCQRGPLVVIQPAGILYTQVKPRDVAEICEKTVANGTVVPRLLYKNPADNEAGGALRRRAVLRQPDSGRDAQHRQDRPHRHRRRDRPRRLCRPRQGDARDDAGAGDRGDRALRPARARRRRVRHRAQVARVPQRRRRAQVRRLQRRRGRSRARSRTARSWRAIRTR